MSILKRIIFACAFVVCSSFCFAKQISFQIVQHDSSLEAVSEQSLVVEDEILMGLFNSGYIVTNSNAAISVSDSQDETLWNTGLGEAFNGYSDYFVQIKLFYTSPEGSTSSKALLNKVNWSISNAKTGTVLAEQSIGGAKGNRDDDLKAVTKNLLVEINKVIKGNKA